MCTVRTVYAFCFPVTVLNSVHCKHCIHYTPVQYTHRVQIYGSVHP